MGLFDKLAAAVGISGMRVSVVSADAQQYRGGPVRATVTLEGGATEQPLMMLTADLVEFWVTGSGKSRTYHSVTRARQELLGQTTVAPSYSRQFEVSLTIPDTARCSRRREGWNLNVEAHIPWAVDARASTVLKVLPHPEVLAVQRAVKGPLGLIPVSWDGSGAAVVYDFSAPDWMQSVLDGVAVRLEVDGQRVVGELIVNPQEHGLADVFRAVVRADRERLPLSIPRGELLTKRGSPNPNGALPYLKDLFARIGVVPPETPVGGTPQL